jgi:hypothetical protein
MAKCKATRRDGTECQAQAQAGREYCYFHDPTKAEAVKAARSRGGSSIKTLTPKAIKPWRGEPGETMVIRSPRPQDVVNLLADTIDEVKAGQIDPKIANAVGYLSNVILKAFETEALDERLAAIEDAVGVKR